MLPTRRDVHFELPPERIHDWNTPSGTIGTLFFNTLSVFFPVGERFFIHSVRHYRDRITDPELQQAVTAFIGQEAMHGREHMEYNELMEKAGMPVTRMERIISWLLEGVKKLPKPLQLSATTALEHLTAILADVLLKDDRLLKGSDPAYAALWRWHALEETEHKAVSFDVYQTVMGRGLGAYLLRVFGLIIATSIFILMVIPFHLRMVAGVGKLTDLRGWGQLLNMQWGRVGGLRRVILPWLDYFRPSFHPWDHDNRHMLAQMDEVLAAAEASALPRAA